MYRSIVKWYKIPVVDFTIYRLRSRWIVNILLSQIINNMAHKTRFISHIRGISLRKNYVKGEVVKLFISLFAVLFCSCVSVKEKPLKVYILAGQSNMEGQARSRVIDYMKEDPKTLDLYNAIKDSQGNHKLIKNTWISYITGDQGKLDAKNREVHGQLTVGYGTQGRRDYSKPGDVLGPELAFGITIQKHLGEPVLIIKSAWGGQSLYKDFRSPSSGPYLETKYNKGKFETAEKAAKTKASTGARYRQMIEHVRHVLKDIKRVCPDYKGQGFELAGFPWFQGWNDMVDSSTYPNRNKPGGYAEYSECMANFIRDVRKDLSAPKMPFVIGVMGVSGEDIKGAQVNFRDAMAAPEKMSEFQGNVKAVQTAPFWDKDLDAIDKKHNQVRQLSYHLRIKHKKYANSDGKMSKQDQRKHIEEYRKKLFTDADLELEKKGKSNAGYHYLGSAKIYSLIGQAFAKTIIEMSAKK